MFQSRNFKVGDNVYVHKGYGRGTLSRVKVEKITPSGQIVVSGFKTRFKQGSGWQIGSGYDPAHLSHKTDSLDRQYAEQVCRHYLNTAEIEFFDMSEIETVTSIFKRGHDARKAKEQERNGTALV